MSFEFWFLYAATIFLASIVPGPSMLLALTHGIKYGAKRTVAAAMGNVTASLIQAGITMAGLGAVLMASESLFMMIKWLGAVYLVIIGINTLRSSVLNISVEHDGPGNKQVSLPRMYFQAFVVAAGNPKAIIFFTALFPQFINPEVSHGLQFLVLMFTLSGIAFCCFMIYAVGGEKIVSLFVKDRARKLINRIIGTTFIGAGIGLALSDR